mmetsp:Transcript_35621/g.76888  ORF Transcript_35621/g.76888 Transcript_35621/m.76888 type:complete len:120 (+) Transcript_35621:169-528(+)
MVRSAVKDDENVSAAIVKPKESDTSPFETKAAETLEKPLHPKSNQSDQNKSRHRTKERSVRQSMKHGLRLRKNQNNRQNKTHYYGHRANRETTACCTERTKPIAGTSLACKSRNGRRAS